MGYRPPEYRSASVQSIAPETGLLIYGRGVKPKKPIKHRLFLDKPIDEMAYTNRDWLAVKKRLMT